MKTKQLALDALKKCLDEFGPEHDGTDFESECTECWTAKQAREAVAALEADIAQAVEPVAWISQESLRRLREGGNDSKGTVPVHASRTYVSKAALFTTPLEPAVNAELLEALKRCKFDSLNMSLADMAFCRAAYLKATS